MGGDSFLNTIRAPAEGIRARYLCLPERMGPKINRGHCVLAIGVFENQGVPFVWMRNSFGKRWGFYGDFSIPLKSFDAD